MGIAYLSSTIEWRIKVDAAIARGGPLVGMTRVEVDKAMGTPQANSKIRSFMTDLGSRGSSIPKTALLRPFNTAQV